MKTKNQQKICDQKVELEKAGVRKSAPIEEVGAVESDHPVHTLCTLHFIISQQPFQ